MEPQKRMQALNDLLKAANYLYYVLDNPTMQDFE